MENPWLSVPLDDYEGHMSLPAVGQLTALADLFAEVLEQRRPASVAILGVAGGNGLGRINPAVTKRIVGVDCNPDYLENVRTRYAALPGLELHCMDLAAERMEIVPVDLVHAALVFEHAGTARCLENAVSLIRPRGTMSVVLQLPSTEAADVSPTPFAAMQELKREFRLIDPLQLAGVLNAFGLRLSRETRRPLPGGKAFWLGLFTNC